MAIKSYSSVVVGNVNDGQKGDQGYGVQKATPQYYLSSSSTALTNGTWTYTKPSVPSGKYLWTRIQTTIDNPGKTKIYSDAVYDASTTGLSQTVDQNTQKITSKVWQTDITSSINSYDGSTGKAIRDRVTKTETDIGGLKTTVSDQASKISTKADGTTVEALTNRVSKNEQDAASFKTTVSEIYETKTDSAGNLASAKSYADSKASSAQSGAQSYTDNKLKNYSTTTQMNSAISQKADSITSTVSKTYETKTDSAGNLASAKSYADSKASSAQSGAQSYTDNKLKNYSTTTQMNSAISQKADSITSTVSKTYETKTDSAGNLASAKSYADSKASSAQSGAQSYTDNKLKNYSTTSQMTSAINQKADSITSEVKKVDQKIDDLQVGGRNLWLNSSFSENLNNIRADGINGYTTEFTTEDGFKCFHIFGQTNNISFMLYPKTEPEVNEGDVLTLSADFKFKNIAKGPSTNSFPLYGLYTGGETRDGKWIKPRVIKTYNIPHGADIKTPIISGNQEWKRIGFTFQYDYTPSNKRWGACLYFRNFTGEVFVKNVKFERGNQPTDWSPAPEDLTSYTDSQIKQTSDSITQQISSVNNGKNIIQQINLNSGGLKINVDNLEIGSAISNLVTGTVNEYAINTSSSTSPTSGWSTTQPAWSDGKYIWMRTKTTTKDGTVSYSNAACITGAKGSKGDTGATGAKGADGVSPTVSISKSGSTTTISITDKNGTHTQTVLDGTNGTPGAKGADGKTSYLHVKYSNDGGETFTANSGEAVGTYIGTCTDYNSADPTTVGSYTWARIKGDTGPQGPKGKDGNFWVSNQDIDLTSSSYNVNTWYPVVGTSIPFGGTHEFKVASQLNGRSHPSWSTHRYGFSVMFEVEDQADGWGTIHRKTRILTDDYKWGTGESPVSYTQLRTASFPVFWLRGGGFYSIYSTYNTTWSIKTSTYIVNDESIAPLSHRPAPEGVNILSTLDSKNKVIYSTSDPSSTSGYKAGDTWFNKSTGGIWQFNGSAWAVHQVGTVSIQNGAITADKIVSSAVTADKIASSAVTADKIASRTITANNIKAGVITATEIAAGTITGDKLAARTITADRLKAGAITSNEIAAGTITANNIASRAITADRIKSGAITANEILGGTITADKIASQTLTADKIKAGAITSNEIAAGTITANNIASRAITADRIKAGALTATEMAAGTITADKVNMDSLQTNIGYIGNKSGRHVEITSDAVKLMLDGSTILGSFGSGGISLGNVFSVDPSGNGAYSGKITAKSGTIGGWTIDSVSLSRSTVSGSRTTKSLLADGKYAIYGNETSDGVVYNVDHIYDFVGLNYTRSWKVDDLSYKTSAIIGYNDSTYSDYIFHMYNTGTDEEILMQHGGIRMTGDLRVGADSTWAPGSYPAHLGGNVRANTFNSIKLKDLIKTKYLTASNKKFVKNGSSNNTISVPAMSGYNIMGVYAATIDSDKVYPFNSYYDAGNKIFHVLGHNISGADVTTAIHGIAFYIANV